MESTNKNKTSFDFKLKHHSTIKKYPNDTTPIIPNTITNNGAIGFKHQIQTNKNPQTNPVITQTNPVITQTNPVTTQINPVITSINNNNNNSLTNGAIGFKHQIKTKNDLESKTNNQSITDIDNISITTLSLQPLLNIKLPKENQFNITQNTQILIEEPPLHNNSPKSSICEFEIDNNNNDTSNNTNNNNDTSNNTNNNNDTSNNTNNNNDTSNNTNNNNDTSNNTITKKYNDKYDDDNDEFNNIFETKPISTTNSTTNSNNRTLSFTEYYRPTKSLEIVGNEYNIQKLREWIRERKTLKSSKFMVSLIHGNPGIGKTSVVHALLKEEGFSVYEVNASLCRTREGIYQEIMDVVTKVSLVGKMAVVLDEFDGYMEGEYSSPDGVLDALKWASEFKEKSSKWPPIICIANELTGKSIQRLKEKVLTLKLYKLKDTDLWKLLNRISTREKITLSDSIKSQLIKTANGDARKLLGLLEMYSDKQAIKTNNNQNIIKESNKDVSFNIFEATQYILYQSRDVPSSIQVLQSDQEILTLMIFENAFRLFGRISQEPSTAFKSKGFSQSLVTSNYKKRSNNDLESKHSTFKTLTSDLSTSNSSSLFPGYVSLFNFDSKDDFKGSATISNTISTTIDKKSSLAACQTLYNISDFYETLCDIDMIEKDNFNDNNLHDITAAMTVHSLHHNRKKKNEYIQNPWIEFTDFFNQRNKLQTNIQKFSNHMEIEHPNESQRKFYLRNQMELMDQMIYIKNPTTKSQTSKLQSIESTQLKKQKTKNVKIK